VLYPDQDGDGVGASPRQVLCIGAAIPDNIVRACSAVNVKLLE
jgi:hypothetical protein